MGLREEIQTKVSAAFDGNLSDSVKSIIYKSITITGYTPYIGTPDRIINEDNTRGVFTLYTSEEVNDETILPTDIRLLVLQNEIQYEPKEDDEVVELDSLGAEVKTYKVVSISKDSAEATYEIQIRTVSRED